MKRQKSAPVSKLSLPEAQKIAEGIVGPIQWKGAVGWCPCPGLARHTKRNAKGDCKVVCEPVPQGGGTLAPGVYCFHGACSSEVEARSFALRSALGKRTAAGRPRIPQPYVIPARPKPPEFDPVKLERIASKLPLPEPTERYFLGRSDVGILRRTAASVLHRLYRPGENVVIFDDFESPGQAVWTHPGAEENEDALDSFRRGKEHGVWFLCNPVTGEYLPNDQGKMSRRSWQNVTAWRFLVLESDVANPAHWLSALAQLPLRIAAIYTSGGKSIHALVRVDAGSKEEWDTIADEIKPSLITLGADRKAISAVRLTRLPWCERREKRAVQTLLYINCQPSGTPICEQESFL